MSQSRNEIKRDKKRRKRVRALRKWLKELREREKLSQTTVAKQLGITQHYYSMIENGERQKDLDLSIVMKFAELFGVTVEWIAEQEKKHKAA